MGRPARYAVQPNEKGTRVFALTRVLHGNEVLRALLTVRDERDAFYIAHLLTFATRRTLDGTLAEAERVLSASSTIAVRNEIARLVQSP